jgi:hypothetical protein
MTKKLRALERDRKDKGKEDKLKTKEERKMSSAKKKEEGKLQEVKRKEMEKQQKEQVRKEEKARQQLKKDIMVEIRRFRNDANASVLQFFDNEEDDLEKSSAITSTDPSVIPSSQQSSNSDRLLDFIHNRIQPLPDIKKSSLMNHNNLKKDTTWDDIFYIGSNLHLFKPMLGLGRGVNFDDFIRSLELPSTPVPQLKQEQSSNNESKMNNNDDSRMEVDHGDEFEFEPGQSSSGIQNQGQFEKKVFVELEKIELHITKILLNDVHSLLDLVDSKEMGGDVTKKASASNNITLHLPLNQMTWIELARMSLLGYLLAQSDRSKEDIQHALRGSKQPSFRIAKNIVRNIRYRWFLRNKISKQKASAAAAAVEEDAGVTEMNQDKSSSVVIRTNPEDRVAILTFLASAKDYSTVHFDKENYENLSVLNDQRKIQRPLLNIFNSENEMESELTRMAEDSNISEIYRRCCKVMLKILTIPSSKNFLWEVDQELYPDYYSVMKRPLMFANVASNLISKVYDSSFSASEINSNGNDYDRIGKEFYADLRQVLLNCISFSTELPVVVASAQKLLLTIHRYIHQWVFSSSSSSDPSSTVPPIDHCSDNYCLVTGDYMVTAKIESIKCGKCQGIYSLNGLESCFSHQKDRNVVISSTSSSFSSLKDFYVEPAAEVLNQVNEEWHCPLCLREDYCLFFQRIPKSLSDDLSSYLDMSATFFVDEWGPSALLPWQFNLNHCNSVKNMMKNQPYLIPILDALVILSEMDFRGTQGASSSSSSSSSSSVAPSSIFPFWNFIDKIKVLTALCYTLNANNKSLSYINSLHNECEKLLKLCSKTNFREADFLTIVKSIDGDEDAFYCRNLLDGIDQTNQNGSNSNSSGSFSFLQNEQTLLQSMITEGRCIFCNGSTFEDEMEVEDGEEVEAVGGGKKKLSSQNKVILCDGCNAEVHLKCLNLSTVSLLLNGFITCLFCCFLRFLQVHGIVHNVLIG